MKHNNFRRGDTVRSTDGDTFTIMIAHRDGTVTIRGDRDGLGNWRGDLKFKRVDPDHLSLKKSLPD